MWSGTSPLPDTRTRARTAREAHETKTKRGGEERGGRIQQNSGSLPPRTHATALKETGSRKRPQRVAVSFFFLPSGCLLGRRRVHKHGPQHNTKISEANRRCRQKTRSIVHAAEWGQAGSERKEKKEVKERCARGRRRASVEGESEDAKEVRRGVHMHTDRAEKESANAPTRKRTKTVSGQPEGRRGVGADCVGGGGECNPCQPSSFSFLYAATCRVTATRAVVERTVSVECRTDVCVCVSTPHDQTTRAETVKAPCRCWATHQKKADGWGARHVLRRTVRGAGCAAQRRSGTKE